MTFIDDEGNRWEPTAVSEVGRRLNETAPENPLDCVVCSAEGVEKWRGRNRHAVAFSLLEFDKEGEPAMASLPTCTQHTGQWRMIKPLVIHDGQTQRWN